MIQAIREINHKLIHEIRFSNNDFRSTTPRDYKKRILLERRPLTNDHARKRNLK